MTEKDMKFKKNQKETPLGYFTNLRERDIQVQLKRM